jgi:hypothetical protein
MGKQVMGLKRFLRPHRTDTPTTNPIQLDPSDVYRVLSSSRRRTLLVALEEGADEPVSREELARIVAGVETDTPVRHMDADAVHRASVALYQSHLPLLAELGVVDWNRDTDAVGCSHSVPGLSDVILDVQQRVHGVGR